MFDETFSLTRVSEFYFRFDDLMYKTGRGIEIGVANKFYENYNSELGSDANSWQIDLQDGVIMNDNKIYHNDLFTPYEDLIGATVGLRFHPANYTLHFLRNDRIIGEVQDSWFRQNTFFPGLSFIYPDDSFEFLGSDKN